MPRIKDIGKEEIKALLVIVWLIKEMFDIKFINE